MTKEQRAYLNDMADREFEKYKRCINNAKECCERNDAKGLKHWLEVSSMALRQSAEYRTRRSY